MPNLDDVLLGADPTDVRSIQRQILDAGGNLNDPAWIPYAAAQRVKLEIQRAVPDAVRSAVDATSKDASNRFLSTIASQAQPVLRDLAARAAMTPVHEATRRATWLAAMTGLFVAFLAGALASAGAGALFREIGWTTPPGLSDPDQDRLAWARRFDDPTRRQTAEWAASSDLQRPEVRAAVDWMLERRLSDPGRREVIEWAVGPTGQFARRFFLTNDFLARGECPSAHTDRDTGRRTCTVWYVSLK